MKRSFLQIPRAWLGALILSAAGSPVAQDSLPIEPLPPTLADLPASSTPQATESGGDEDQSPGLSSSSGTPSIAAAPLSDEVLAERASVLKARLEQLITHQRHYKSIMIDVIAEAYESRAFRPLWGDLPPETPLHRQLASALLDHAFPEWLALDPEDLAQHISTDAPVPAVDLARTTAILDAALLVRLGALPTETVWEDWNKGDTPGTELRGREALLSDLITASSLRPFDLEKVFEVMEPKNWIYRELQSAYPEARESVLRYSGLPNLPDPSSAGVGRPDEAYPYAGAIAAHLVDKGYLVMSESERASLATMSPPLVEGLKKFQEENGLDSDGIFGPTSWRYLNTNAADRYRSLTLNLHRARLLPADFGERYLLVNLPTAELYGFEANDFHTITTRVVHGKASKDSHRTPIFRDVMGEIVFGPYWNIPKSIAVKEILPKAEADWGFLSRNRYQIVSSFSASGAQTHRISPANLQLVSEGRLFLRQLPGPTNSLGRVKFLLPNSYNVYLHDTPAKAYFARTNRDHSHGCIRVKDPRDLGAWVLKTQDWTADEVEAAMFADDRKSEPIRQKVNVYIVYFTTFPRPTGDGRVVLAPARDVYERDSELAHSLAWVVPWKEPARPVIVP
ncbi:MAG: L,D-transpeptidase family protein [Verrucomicrobiota bacterium]